MRRIRYRGDVVDVNEWDAVAMLAAGGEETDAPVTAVAWPCVICGGAVISDERQLFCRLHRYRDWAR
jgi:hypothetical protein